MLQMCYLASLLCVFVSVSVLRWTMMQRWDGADSSLSFIMCSADRVRVQWFQEFKSRWMDEWEHFAGLLIFIYFKGPILSNVEKSLWRKTHFCFLYTHTHLIWPVICRQLSQRQSMAGPCVQSEHSTVHSNQDAVTREKRWERSCVSFTVVSERGPASCSSHNESRSRKQIHSQEEQTWLCLEDSSQRTPSCP